MREFCFWVEQGIWSERDQQWVFRHWASYRYDERTLALREARKLSHGRVLKIEIVWEGAEKEVQP